MRDFRRPGPRGEEPVEARALERETRAMRELVAGNQPDVGGEFLVTPTTGQPYIRGTVLRAIGFRWVGMPSGLLVPEGAARRPAPIDLVKAYVSDEEVFGQAIPREQIEAWLRQTTRMDVIRGCAKLLGERQSIGADWRTLDLALAAEFKHDVVRARAANMVREGRALVAPQGVLLLVKLALRMSPADGVRDLGQLAAMVIAAQSGLDQEEGEAEDRLFAVLIRNQTFAADMEPGTQLASFRLRWVDLARRLADHPEFEDLPALFADATGLPFDDMRTIGFGLLVEAWSHPGRVLSLAAVSDRLGWERDRAEASLAHIAARPGELAALIAADEAEFGEEWSFDPLRRFPVIREGDDAAVVLAPGLLLDRIFGWLPIFDLREGLKGRDRRRADRALTFLRRTCEREALDSLGNLVQGPTTRLYEEERLRAAFGIDRRTADAALDYGDAWIVAEISTRQLVRGTVIGGQRLALEDDLRLSIDEKCAQIQATMDALIADESRLTGHPAVHRRIYIPLLIVTEGFPVNPLTATEITARLGRLGLFRDPRIAPLRIIDQEELYFLEGVSEREGASLLDLIEGHLASGLAGMGMKDYLILDRRADVRRPTRLAGPMREAWMPLMRAVGMTEEEIAADDADDPPAAGPTGQ